MKSVRPFLIVLGVIAVLCAALVAVALTPGFQRWAVRRAVAARPGLQLEIARVSAGWSGISLGGVAFRRNGLTVKLDRLDADYSLGQVIFGRRLQIHQLTASGLLVDASKLSPAKAQAAAAGAPAAAPGLLGQLQLPVELVLDDVRIEGRALLPGSPAIETDYKITGGRFAPGQEGSLLLAAALKNPAADADVSVLNVQVSLRATQTPLKTFSRVGLTAVVDAAGRSISDQSQLKISAELVRDSAGENYAVSADTLLKGTAENVLTVKAVLQAGGKEYSGQWTLKARAAQLQPFLLGGILPEFTAHGEGRFTFNPATAAASLQGSVDADASHLELIEPALRAIGPVSLSARFDVAEAGGIAQLHQLDVKLAGEKPVLELHASSAAELNFKDRRLQVGPSGPGEVLDLNVIGLPLAWIRPFVHEVDVSGGVLSGRFAVTADSDRLMLRAVQPLRVDEVSVVQRGQLLLDKASLTISAEATLTAQELTARVSRLSLKTPAGDSLTAQATVVVPVAPAPAIAVTANYSADLPKLLAPWLQLGRLQAAGDADFTLAGSRVDLRRLSATVNDAGGALLLKVAALRPFSLDLATRRASTTQAGAVDLLSLGLGRIPLDHLPLNQPDAKLGGVVEQGEFVLAADGEKLILRASTPLVLSGLSLDQGGQAALSALRVEARPSVEVTGHASVKGQTGEVTVKTATGVTLLSFKGEATRTVESGLRAALTFNLEVPALSTQPLFAGAQAVTAGRASGEIRASLGGANQVEARLTINGLVARDGGQTLPVANLSFRAVAQNDGRISVQAPLLLDRAGQRSDLSFSLDLVPARGVFGLDGKLTGEHVELADALSVMGVFLASAAPGDPAPAAAKAPTGKVTADTAPAWARFKGTLALDVKSVTRGSDWAMTGLTGLVRIEPAQITLEKLEAAFGEKSRLAAKGQLHFTAGPMPYELGGDFSLDEFDAGKLFKALEPAKPATVEGFFSIKGHFTGGGETLDRTLERTRGSFELTSRQGVFRGLQRTSSKVSMTSKAVELGASVLGSIFGSQKVTKAAEKVAGTAYFVDQLAQSVGELNYDQLSVKLVRDDALNMNLEDISLVSPDIRLLGKGTVTYAADKPLLEQPLSASLSLAGRGKIEQLLGKLKLLDGNRDELGYAKTREAVTIGGSLAKPDPTAFFTRIATSKIGDLLGTDN
jgi:hypothetical protein